MALDLDYDFPLPLPGDDDGYYGREVLVGTDPDDGTTVTAHVDRAGYVTATCWRGALATTTCARTLAAALGRVVEDRNRFDPRLDVAPVSFADLLDALDPTLIPPRPEEPR